MKRNIPVHHSMKRTDLFAATLPLRFTDEGRGRIYLVIHGGSGPGSVRDLAGTLSRQGNRVIVPTHPGFDGASRPEWFYRVSDLATTYLALIDDLDLSNVTVIGHSFGGWISAEMASRNSSRISAFVLMDAAGIDPGASQKEIVDPMGLSPDERARRAFFDEKYVVAPPTAEAMEVLRNNYEMLNVYSGHHYMHDPSLGSRLPQIRVPILFLWGEADGIVHPEYGRRYADNVPNSVFKLIAEAGHSPHIEKLGVVSDLICKFAREANASVSNLRLFEE